MYFNDHTTFNNNYGNNDHVGFTAINYHAWGQNHNKRKRSSKHWRDADAATLLQNWNHCLAQLLAVQLAVLSNLLLASQDGFILLLDTTNAQIQLIVV